MASGITFEEIECKTIVNKTVHAVVSTGASTPTAAASTPAPTASPDGTHEYLGYDAGRDFESRIVVKINAAQVLRQQLSKPSWKRELIVLGTACDPYQQAEMKYEITRKCLRVLLDFRQPVHMLTKSPARPA